MTPRIIKEIIAEEFSNCPEKRTQEVSYSVIKKFADRWNIIIKDENDEEKNSSHDDLPSKYTDSDVWWKPKRYRDSAKVAREKFPNIDQQMDDLIKDFISEEPGSQSGRWQQNLVLKGVLFTMAYEPDNYNLG